MAEAETRKRGGGAQSPSSSGERDRDLAQFIGKERAEKVTELFVALMPLFHALGRGE